jgi:hypothetical protein
MFDPSSITTDVLFDGDPLEINPETGRIESPVFNPGDQLTIRVRTAPGEVIAFTANSRGATNRPGAVFTLRDISPSGDHRTFKLRLTPIKQANGTWINQRYANRLRLAWLEGSELVLWQATVVYHQHQAFLYSGVQRRALLVRHLDGSVEAPVLNWPEMVEAVMPIVRRESLMSAFLYEEPAPADASHLPHGQALVAWYDPSLMMGVALLRDGSSAAIYADNILAEAGTLPVVSEGTIIEYGTLVELPNSRDFPFKLARVVPKSLVSAG